MYLEIQPITAKLTNLSNMLNIIAFQIKLGKSQHCLVTFLYNLKFGKGADQKRAPRSAKNVTITKNILFDQLCLCTGTSLQEGWENEAK